MKVYCTPRFKTEYEKLNSKKTYRDLSKIIAEYFYGKTIDEIESGRRIFDIQGQPWIKKRLGGSAKYRIDYVIIEKNDETFLIFIYPKTGSDGASDLQMQFRKKLLKEFYELYQNQEFIEVVLEEGKISFR